MEIRPGGGLALPKYDPRDEAVRLYDQGSEYYRKGRKKEARSIWKKSIEKYPLHPLSHFLMAFFYEEKAQFDKAIEEYLQGLEIQPLDGTARCCLGQLYLKKKRIDDALEEFEKALEILPGNAYFHYWAGVAWHKKGDPEKAYSYLTKSSTYAPSEPLLRRDLGFLAAEMGKTSEAIEHFQCYLAMSPDAIDRNEIMTWMSSA